MAISRRNPGPKEIQILEYMDPCRVLQTFSETDRCRSYLVSMSMRNGTEVPRFLQIFPPEHTDICQRTEAALTGAFGRDKIRSITGSEGAGYLLIDLPSRQRLDWRAVLAEPLSARLETLVQLGRHLSSLEDRGILPDGIDIRTWIRLPEGGLCSWDLHSAVLTEGADSQDLLPLRRRCALDYTRLILQALTGKTAPGTNCLTRLKLMLHGRMRVSDQEELLGLLDDYLYTETRTDLAQLTDAVELAAMSLELYESQNIRIRDTHLAAAHFLRHHPLWKYVRTNPDGSRHLSILLVGGSPMRKAFLDTIIPSAQMLDTQMHIRITAEDAAAFCDAWLKKAPLLAHTATITHIPERPGKTYKLNEQLTGTDRRGNALPLVHLTFEEAAFPDKSALQELDTGCILLTESCTEQMRGNLLELAGAERRPILIGLKDPVPENMPLRKLGSRMVLDFFAKGTAKSRIWHEALTVHTFFSKEYRERASREAIAQEFRDPYNRNSSIRSALTIPYKLAAYDLADCPDAANRFHDEVLRNEDRLGRLIWLEHRSWQAHLILNGWTLDPDTFETDFVNHHYRHKDQRWHSCLFGSSEAPREGLAQWSMADWEQKDPGNLDPLDRMSVAIHRKLAEYVQHTVNPALEKDLQDLKPHLIPGNWHQLQNAVRALQTNATNAAVGWERVMNDLRQKANTADVTGLLDRLTGHAALLLKRNGCVQYKDLDRAIITAIPYLLEKDSIGCVYKLWSDREHPWSNIASAFFMEPGELCLLTTDGQTVTQKQRKEFLDFLQDRRGIEITLRVLPLTQLRKIRKDAVLDVTGADTEQLLTALRHLSGIGAAIPLVHYKDGKMRTLEGNFPLVRFYRCNQTLTVEEMMAVTGTKVHSENEIVPMQQLTNCETLWQAAQQTESYNLLSNFLSACRKKGWKVIPLATASCPAWLPQCNQRDAEKTGLLALLTELEKAGIIQPVSWSAPQVYAIKPVYQKSLNQMLDAYRSADPVTRGRLRLSFKSEDQDALCVLEDMDLTFDQTFEIRKFKSSSTVTAGSGRDSCFIDVDKLTKGLKTLHRLQLIQQLGTEPLDQKTTRTKTERRDGKDVTVTVSELRLRFSYRDLPTMDTLTKAGNALEALAYHTIRNMDVFDDVKLGVSILWGERVPSGTPTHNEIDLVCTKGTRSFFISCKKVRELHQEQITEIRYETDRFGINGTAILLTTAQEKNNKACYARAQRMGVEVITLKDEGTEDSANILRTRIEDILKKHCT